MVALHPRGRTQTESSTAPGVPSGGSRQGPAMDGTAAQPRASASALQHAAQPPQPRKKRPEDFKFGKILGEGSFSTVSTRRCRLLDEGVLFGSTGLSRDAELGAEMLWWRSTPEEPLGPLGDSSPTCSEGDLGLAATSQIRWLKYRSCDFCR